jgi:uncharacterized membrane protein YeaQ/YmgE (transglycosylase-associated protein family)
MYLSNESLLVILFVGIVAGWLAGKIVDGGGFGLIGDLVVGIIGAFIGDWLLPRLDIHLGTGIVSAILNATIGAVILLLIVRAIVRRSYWGGGWGNGGGWGWRGRWGGRW